MRGLAYFLGLAAGFGLTLQVGMNARCARSCSSAYSAALISFTGGYGGADQPAAGHPHRVPGRDALAAVPPWAWFGGLFGAFYVAISTIVAAELGATSLLALALAGQLVMALVVDHYGWLGLPENPITWVRLRGSPAGRGSLADHALTTPSRPGPCAHNPSVPSPCSPQAVAVGRHREQP